MLKCIIIIILFFFAKAYTHSTLRYICVTKLDVVKMVNLEMRKTAKTVTLAEIRSTIVHAVLLHGMTMRESGQRVQSNLNRFSAASISKTVGKALLIFLLNNICHLADRKLYLYIL